MTVGSIVVVNEEPAHIQLKSMQPEKRYEQVANDITDDGSSILLGSFIDTNSIANIPKKILVLRVCRTASLLCSVNNALPT